MYFRSITISALSALAIGTSKNTAGAFSHFSTSFIARNVRQTNTASITRPTPAMSAAVEGQAEIVLVGCGAPNRGMGWYHATQMLDEKCPSASLDYVVEPWFMGPGAEG
eukprot:CAMPEP_0172497314 /NCGR_PEP_ID=MMETSP1066-20121228/98091_1 /TAXON_ID=671091 /ORGANISM="Coscinodiscus wailesii, Strain CCMP2513" /LENGTH=108 /DNA_ID=CAMNT_0013270005 /DNA_START=117 /DNA_END=440 /DNA_ORIENTATION=-